MNKTLWRVLEATGNANREQVQAALRAWEGDANATA